VTTLRLRENRVRQPFFDDQPEPEPMSRLRQKIRDNDRLPRTGLTEQEAVLVRPNPAGSKLWRPVLN
jgi:hypothetical protein